MALAEARPRRGPLSPDTWSASVGKLTYFTDDEVAGLEPEVAMKLDQARHVAGVPFVITSKRRTVEQNASVGGVSDSAHLKGLAADLAVPDSGSLYHMVAALLQVGFKRLVIGIKIRPENGVVAYHNLHCDLDSSLPTPVIAVKRYGA
jgi:zinc D-Ala-D-Ala carboxypeptidase